MTGYFKSPINNMDNKVRYFSALPLNSLNLHRLCVMGLLIIGLGACQNAPSSQDHTAQSLSSVPVIPVDGEIAESGGARDVIDRALAKAAATGTNNASKTQSLYAAERAYKQAPNDIGPAIAYARSLRQEGLARRGLLILRSHLTSNPDHAEGLSEYAACNLAIGQYQEAESAARKAVVTAPKFYKAYHVLGVALDAQGFHKQAEVAFRRGLEHWEGDPVPILNNLALSLAAQGYLDESLSILRRAAASAPNRTEIERNLRIISALQVNTQKITPDENTNNKSTPKKTRQATGTPNKQPPLPPHKPT